MSHGPAITAMRRSVKTLGDKLAKDGWTIDIDEFATGPGGVDLYGPSYVELTITRTVTDDCGMADELTHTGRFICGGWTTEYGLDVYCGSKWSDMRAEFWKRIGKDHCGSSARS